MMAPWLIYIGKLLAALAQFLQANPFPHQQRVALRQANRVGVAVFYAVHPGMSPAEVAERQAQAAQYAAQFAPRETVADTITRVEGGREVVYQWVERSTEPGAIILTREGKQVGGWNKAGRMYLDFDGAANRWATKQVRVVQQVCNGQRCVPVEVLVEVPDWKDCSPCPLPNEAKPATGAAPPDVQPPTGVNFEKLKEKGRKYTHGDREVSREHAFEALMEKTLPADFDALRIACIGPGSNAAKLRQDLIGDAVLAAWSGKVTLQAYDSVDAPMVKDLGFAAAGVHVQSPTGVPLWYAASYDGPSQLADGLQLADARRKDPNWDPRKWPDLAKPAVMQPAPDASPAAPTSDSMPSLKTCCVCTAAGILVVLLLKSYARQRLAAA